MNALRRVIVPIVVLIVAGLTAFWPSPSSIVILGPANLAVGTTETVWFSAPYSEQYEIGVMFDQQAAKNLFPCTADLTKFGRRCVGTELSPWPVDLKLATRRQGEDWPVSLLPTHSTAGGEYSGRDTFIRPVAYASLKSGQRYALTVRSLANWDGATAASPRIVVQVSSPGFGDRRALIWLARSGAAVLLALVGFFWLCMAFLARPRRVRPSVG